MIVSNLQSQVTISQLVDQLKSAYDQLTNAFERAQKESVKSEISGKATEINELMTKTALAIGRALSRGIISDSSQFLLKPDVATQLKAKWAAASNDLDKVECFRISSEIERWSTETLEGINDLWTTKLTDLEQEIRTSVTTITVVKPEKNYTDFLNRLELLRRPLGGYRSIVDIKPSTWKAIEDGRAEIQQELESIKDIPDHVMNFLRQQFVSLAEYESEDFKPTKEWISKNPAIVERLIVKWGN